MSIASNASRIRAKSSKSLNWFKLIPRFRVEIDASVPSISVNYLNLFAVSFINGVSQTFGLIYGRRYSSVSTDCVKTEFSNVTRFNACIYLSSAPIFRPIRFSKVRGHPTVDKKKNIATASQSCYDKKKKKRTWDYVRRIHNNYYTFSFA